MRKEFNVTGPCNPRRHYMADISRKLDAALALVRKGHYFTIARPRQFGKTSILNALYRRLSADGVVAACLSFEGIGDAVFRDEPSFCSSFFDMLADNIAMTSPEAGHVIDSIKKDIHGMMELSNRITEFIRRLGRDVVLLIDEVDKSSDNQLFVSFLGMLREQYIAADRVGAPSFLSVVLVGIHDVKSLKLKLRPDAEAKLNSPWNIAADFDVDFSLDPAEIASMLSPYAADAGVSMDVLDIAARLHYYTSGHPFLVSKLCKILDEEQPAPGSGRALGSWTAADVDWAFRRLVRDDYTTANFDDLVKNLENNSKLLTLTEKVLFGIENDGVAYSLKEPTVNLGVLYGILLGKGGRCAIANRIYEQIVSDYITAKICVEGKYSTPPQMAAYYAGGVLHMERVLLAFQAFLREHRSATDGAFLEREGRLVFMSFIKPIVNGSGFLWKEPVVGDERRMDLVVTYGPSQKEVVELKVWRGQAYHEAGLRQLSDYLDFQGLSQGYILVFDFCKEKSYKSERVEFQGKSIFAVWV